ncbi:MAG: ATP-binding protein [Coriobacteriia bacterium]|nr:ATP-binding protein [Coriobacteriia bacterium]
MAKHSGADEIQLTRHGSSVVAVIVLGVFVVLLTGVTFFVLGHVRNTYTEEAESLVLRDARHVALDIATFVEERRTDALIMSQQRGMSQRVLDYLDDDDARAGEFLKERLTVECQYHDLDGCAIFDAEGAPVMWAGTAVGVADVPVAHVLAAAATSDPQSVDSVRTGSYWRLWLLYPMPEVDGRTFVLGQYLDIGPVVMDFIERHRELSESGENLLLLKVDGDAVLTICMEDGISVSDVDTCKRIRRTVLGDLGDDGALIVRGIDCTDRRVIGAAVQVPESDWRVFAKVPESDVVALVGDINIVVLVIDLLLFSSAGLAILLLQRSRERRVEQERSLSELQDALAAQDRFLSNMSHELRTPLNSIMGFTSLMLGGMTGPITDEQRKQLGMVDDAGKRLLALVDDVLDLAKLKAGKCSVVPRVFTVGEIVSDTCGLMCPLSARKGVGCDFTLPEEDVELQTDRQMVERILLNLMSNAVKFTDEGLVRLEVVYDRESDTVCFVVRDTGRGIAGSDVASIMEEFTQVVEPRGVKPVGAGLGLAISRRMAEALGGSLTAESEVGVGSTFTVTLPRVYGGDGETDL